MTDMATELSSVTLDISLVSMFIGMILWVVFGQVTVRKLRNNPATKDRLGIEFYSGWDILVVAQTISLPRGYVRLRDKNPFTIPPKADLLYTHTTKFDRLLGRIFYWTLITAVFSVFLSVLFSWLG
jgi:hypothetical protein